MSRDREYLTDIPNAARLAIEYSAGKTESEFEADMLVQDAVIRRLEVIGEAARRVSDTTREAMPDSPWSAIVGMRNIMIHRYDDVDARIVWSTMRESLPPLITVLEQYLNQSN